MGRSRRGPALGRHESARGGPGMGRARAAGRPRRLRHRDRALPAPAVQRVIRIVALLLAAALAPPLAPREAGAHAALVTASPARRATLAESPPRVELTFSERLEPAYARLSVEDAGGARVDLGDAALAPGDDRRLRVSLRPLGPGAYTVRFRVLSVDGHVVEASFPFSVRGGSAEAAPR